MMYTGKGNLGWYTKMKLLNFETRGLIYEFCKALKSIGAYAVYAAKADLQDRSGPTLT